MGMIDKRHGFVFLVLKKVLKFLFLGYSTGPAGIGASAVFFCLYMNIYEAHK